MTRFSQAFLFMSSLVLCTWISSTVTTIISKWITNNFPSWIPHYFSKNADHFLLNGIRTPQNNRSKTTSLRPSCTLHFSYFLFPLIATASSQALGKGSFPWFNRLCLQSLLIPLLKQSIVITSSQPQFRREKAAGKRCKPTAFSPEVCRLCPACRRLHTGSWSCPCLTPQGSSPTPASCLHSLFSLSWKVTDIIFRCQNHTACLPGFAEATFRSPWLP